MLASNARYMNAEALLNLHWMAGVSLSGIDWFGLVIITAWLLVGEPLLGRRSFRQFLATVDSGDSDARPRFYRSWLVQSWVVMALVLMIALYGFAWHPAQLGLRMPQLARAFSGSFLPGFLAGASLALVIGLVTGIVLARNRKKGSEAPAATPAGPSPEIMKMLPRTPREQRWFAALAVTAGVTEEVVWRGVLMAMLLAVFPAMPTPAMVFVMATMFGWAHLYQGMRGILATAVLGALLTGLYLLTASLVLPIILHILVDLAAMLRPRVDAPFATP